MPQFIEVIPANVIILFGLKPILYVDPDLGKYGLLSVINNMVLIQWYSGETYYSTNTRSFILPIAYTIDYWIIGVGFWIDSIGAQRVENITLTGFSTSSSTRSTGTKGWITIGS